ncbi:MAG TPA: hypothetical protein VGA62_04865, partial [Acidimicrobiia bacterium]
MLITVAAPAPEVERALVDVLGLHPGGEAFTGPVAGMPDTTATLTAALRQTRAARDRTDVRLVV